MLAVLAALYCFDLARTPVYLGGDEAHFAVGAQSIAATGRNVNGDVLPVFFNLADPLGGPRQPWGDTWYQPLLFYVTAVFVKVLPFNEATIRLPVALIGGLLSPLLLFAVARRFIGDPVAALTAAMILALAPTHIVLSRQALDYICPLPFVLVWLWCLHQYLRSQEARYVTVAGLVLGLGCYSYIASWMMMPLYLLITWLVVWRSGGAIRPIVSSALTFAAPIVCGLAWVAFHPGMLEQTWTRYGVTEGPKAGFLDTYLSVITPTVWFARGGPSLVTSTARSGVVLAPVAVLFVAGVVHLWRRRDWVAAVIVAGLITGPIPAAFKGEPGMIQRSLYVLPFAALLGGFGFAALRRSSSRLWRVAALAVVGLSLLQFGYFYRDYFGHYKLRSAFYYDPVAFRDVADYVMAQPEAPAYFFTIDLDDASGKWRYYTLARGRAALLSRTHYIEPDDRPAAEPRSVLVTYDQANRLAALQRAGWTIETSIRDVDNRPAAVVLRRERLP